MANTLLYKLQTTNYKLRTTKGFSLTEILITMSLFLLLAGVGIGAYFKYYQSALITADIDSVLTLIKDTRFRALKNSTNDNYGIHIDSGTNSIISFRDSYTPGVGDNIVIKLGQLNIKSLDLDPNIGLTNEILFEKGIGKTANTGHFTLGNTYYDYAYNINAQGVIN